MSQCWIERAREEELERCSAIAKGGRWKVVGVRELESGLSYEDS